MEVSDRNVRSRIRIKKRNPVKHDGECMTAMRVMHPSGIIHPLYWGNH